MQDHVSLISRQKLLQLGWVVLISSHQTLHFWISVFQSLQNSLNGQKKKKKKFNSLEDCKNHLEQLFSQKVLGWVGPDGPVVKNQPSNLGMWVRSLVWEL